MPSTTPERAARWPGGYSEAIDHMKAAGYELTRKWTWVLPKPDHVPTEKEVDAVVYLIEEWDFDGIENLTVFLDVGGEDSSGDPTS